MKLILAGNNEKKLKEMREILSDMGCDLYSQREAGLHFTVEETGETFVENARLKASAVVEKTGEAAIADDSGLEVEALEGAPGVHSAYYGGEACKTDFDRLQYLLSRMEGKENRRAAFVSTIVCMFPDGRSIEAEGRLEGEILMKPQGEGGFGYDPVFYVPEAGRTLAQMSAEEKNKISHRGRALRVLKEKWGSEYADK